MARGENGRTARLLEPVRSTMRRHPPRAVAIIFAVSMFMSIMDTQIVNVALPSLSRDFSITTPSVQWVVTAYLMSLAVCVPASGWLGDRFGTKRVYLLAIVTFTVASALCADAVSFPELVAMRVLQGAGCGVMLPVGMAMLYRAYPFEQRIGITRFITRVMVLAPATAPIIGGALVTFASWRWIFVINLPVGCVVAVAGLAFLEEHRLPLEGSFDAVGALFGALGLGLLLFAVGSGPTTGWGSLEVLLSAAGAVVALAAFVRVELTRRHPLLELRILGDRLFRWCSICNTFSTMAFFGSLVFTALYLQEARGFSALQSGLSTFPEAIAIGLASGPVAWLYPRLGPRRLLITGFVGLALATGLLALSGEHTSLWEIRALCFFLGVSVSFVMLPSQAGAFARISSLATGHASAIFNTFQRAAQSLGVALLALVLALAGGDVIRVRAPVAAFHWVFAANVVLALVGGALSFRVRDADAASTMVRTGPTGRAEIPATDAFVD